MSKGTVPAEAKKEWLKGRDNHAGILARNVTLELEGEESPRMILAYRIWEKDQKTGLQLTNRQDSYPERWQWFANNRIVSLTAEPANVPEVDIAHAALTLHNLLNMKCHGEFIKLDEVEKAAVNACGSILSRAEQQEKAS